MGDTATLTDHLTQVDLQPSANITSNDVAVDAVVDKITANAFAHVHATALGAASDAQALIRIGQSAHHELAQVLFETGAQIKADNSVTFNSDHQNVDLTTNADASCSCLGGDTNDTSDISYQSDSNVTGQHLAIIRTSLLNVSVNHEFLHWNRFHNNDGATFDGGGSSGGSSANANRTISWDSKVFLVSPLPVLTVDQSGVISAMKVVTVKDEGGTSYGKGDNILGHTIEVQDLVNSAGGTVNFTAGNIGSQDGSAPPASTITGSQGLFVVEHTWPTVDITNNSPDAMVIHRIEVLSTVGATINVEINTITVQFDVRHEYLATQVNLENLQPGAVGSSSLTIDGYIDNPIGTTFIQNQRGDILAGPDSPMVHTNIANLDADAGSIGFLSGGTRTPLPLELVQSSYTVVNIDPERLVGLNAEAKNDVVLDITSVLRETPSGHMQPSLGPIHAGRNIDIVVNDSVYGTDETTQGDVFVELYDGTQTLPLTVPGLAGSGVYNIHFRPNGVGPLIVPDASRSPVRRLQPLTAWCASCWQTFQYRCLAFEVEMRSGRGIFSPCSHTSR